MRRMTFVTLLIGTMMIAWLWLQSSPQASAGNLASTVLRTRLGHGGATSSAQQLAGPPVRSEPASGSAAPTPTAPTVPPPPTAKPPISPSRLTIESIGTYDAGQASPVLFAHHMVSFRVRYLLAGSAGQRSGYAVFRVVASGATIMQKRVTITRRTSGVVRLDAKMSMPPGPKRLKVVLRVAGLTEHAGRGFMVLDPGAYLVHGRSSSAGGIVETSRIEGNRQTLHEHFTIHLGRRTFGQLGREMGVFQLTRLVWPRIDRSQVAMQAALVSEFGWNGDARAAFWQQVAQYQIDEGCTSRKCKLRVHEFKVSPTVGRYARSGFQIKTYYGVTVREILFVRGPVMVEVWTYLDGSPSKQLAAAVDRAAMATGQRLDRITHAQIAD
jgi:hypothetical protein